MLHALFSKARLKALLRAGPLARFSRDAERSRALHDAQEVSSPPSYHPLHPASDGLPLIVARVEEDARSRVALKRMGYLKVLSAYLRHKREGRDAFHSFGVDHLWPTMDFVRDWLKEERRQLIVRHRWVFLLTLVATLVAGLTFVGALALFG
jgi:hypothetical protein